jgi:hypothetical protein
MTVLWYIVIVIAFLVAAWLGALVLIALFVMVLLAVMALMGKPVRQAFLDLPLGVYAIATVAPWKFLSRQAARQAIEGRKQEIRRRRNRR